MFSGANNGEKAYARGIGERSKERSLYTAQFGLRIYKADPT